MDQVKDAATFGQLEKYFMGISELHVVQAHAAIASEEEWGIMKAKYKVFLVYFLSLVIVFTILWLIIEAFDIEQTFWKTFVPICVAILVTPKIHIVRTQSGSQYGLKSIFSKKVIKFS